MDAPTTFKQVASVFDEATEADLYVYSTVVDGVKYDIPHFMDADDFSTRIEQRFDEATRDVNDPLHYLSSSIFMGWHNVGRQTTGSYFMAFVIAPGDDVTISFEGASFIDVTEEVTELGARRIAGRLVEA